jgi:hypothetical protein
MSAAITGRRDGFLGYKQVIATTCKGEQGSQWDMFKKSHPNQEIFIPGGNKNWSWFFNTIP